MVRTPQPGNTRERILEVALELFHDQGYAGTSIRDIAQRMAITKAAVYYHFPSKESLLAELLTPAMTRVSRVLAEAGEITTPEQRRALVTALVDVVGEVGPQVVVMLSDPGVGSHLRRLATDSSLPQQVGEALIGPLPADPEQAAAARLRAACAIGCLPAGIEAWRREHPGKAKLDAAAKVVLVQAVLAVIESPGH
jgi:TetR/AcrR family transcriptional regulator, regulator of cefoperazone and chloramphenicol sensitivity